MVTRADLPQLACCDWNSGAPQCSPISWASGDCRVRREATLARTAEGRRLLLCEYRAEANARNRDDGKIPPGAVLEKLRELGVPTGLLIGIRAPRMTPALDFAHSWSEARERPGMFLAGSTGCGKSFAAAWALFGIAAKYPWNSGATGSKATPYAWVRAAEFARVDNWDADGVLDRLDEAQRATVLVLDDVGKEATKSGAAAISDLLCYRLDNNKKTIVTTNETGQAFVATYGGHLTDRIKGRCASKRFDEKSLRSP